MQRHAARAEADLFAQESAALAQARAAHDDAQADTRAALAALINHYERLMRESRRLIRRSDRAELDMNQMNRQLHELAQQLEYRATHDTLTGALNRGAIIECATRALAQGDLALIVLDIDHFKWVNDDFGHPAGDMVIQTVVACLQQLLGPEASIGRVGGEEFSVVWPTSELAEALSVAKRICDAIADQVFAAPINRQITASVGVSWAACGGSFETIYSHADEALYAAKRAGRNCVRSHVGEDLNPLLFAAA
ncbi:GGDEF domain-containing protein [Pseudoduganella danionis]|uniref:diguanylate cyclase n=1 Tax=Pseudoduganella danionis TaxID=1890295 RepID=A0ABW9SR97_9BURK|nr:GGDEF domain-containing protein [Pseudoduganella danionis]MTW34676.1 diguanylate cyclase [Pseudoduganella danionis]